MTPPHLPLELWWIIAVAVAVSYLVLMTSLMPTTAYRIRVATAPPLMAAAATITGFLQDLGPAQLLPMYACVMIGLQLGLVGRRREMRRVMADTLAHDAGAATKPKLSLAATIQIIGVCLVAAAAGTWFSYAS